MKHIYALFALLITSFISWGQTYDLVTSNAQLEEGAEYIILGQRSNNTILVMTTTQNSNNRAGVVISGTTLPTTLEAEANYAVFELGLSDGHWTFYDAENEGFLYAASSGSNHLKTRANDSDGNSRWEINIGNDNIASVVAQGDFTRNVMQLNTSSNLFACYGSASQAPVYLYKKGVASTDPILNTSETEITGLGYMEGNASVSQSFSLSGMNLEPTSGNITVTAPANFQVSTDDVSFNNSLNIAYTDGALAATDIYVRLNGGLIVGNYNGDITISGGSANAIVSVEGVVTEFSSICGFEDFSNSELTSSYDDGNFVGNNGITWSYIESRDENGDANESGINGKAIMLRRSSDNSSISSSVISNGIGNFSVKLYKGFTGNGNRQVELFINGVSQGTSTPFNDYEEHIFEVNNINIAGDFTIEIKNITSNQVIIDDITWTCYSEEPTPALSVNFTQEDLHIEHNINATTPTVAEAIVNIANLTEEFNLSVVSTTEDFVVNTTGELVNGENTIQIQLADGLAAGEYNGSIIVSLGEETLATLPLTGEVVDIPLSTPENAIEGLRIYPNPATDVVFVTSNSGAMKNVQLFDLSGKKVLDVDTTFSFQVNALANGIYVMKVTEEGKTSTSKLIVK